MKEIFEGSSSRLYLVDNVYPRIDELNVEPTRKVIQEVFEEHIIHAPGMDHIRDMVSGNIIPTPAGVMEATKVLFEFLGDVITVDVGGATTDIHSVTEGSEEISRIMISPEPRAKRTVEGDLGVYVNADNVIEIATREKIAGALNLSENQLEELINGHKPIPKSALEKSFVEELTRTACHTAALRHAGDITYMYSTAGRKRAAIGKDLTAVKVIVGTGGALTRLPGREDILRSIARDLSKDKLLPNEDARILIDNHYIMASIGVLSKTHFEESLLFLKQSLNIMD